jgi:uncharacterized membrane protein
MNSRIFHLDTIRAFAILMMLQGHFVNSLLEDTFRDTSNFFFNTWLFCRGFTAPLFFTVTGLVITYLLFRTDDPEKQNKRVSKTVKRAWKLILWGYVLNTNIFYVLSGHFSKGFFSVNVLHCIGLGLLVLMGLFLAIGRENKKFYQNLLLVLGLGFFIFEPAVRTYEFAMDNSFLLGYLTKANGSVFTPLPWLGYSFFGGFLGMIYVRFYHNRKASYVMMAGLVLAGTLMVLFSSRFFMNLSILFQVELFKDIAYNNYLFIRLGYVFIIIAVFFGLENLLSKLPSLNKIGQNTLNIYIVHYIILYGSIFGLGLSHFYYRALAPAQVITGAAIFMIISVFLAGKAQHVSVRDILKNLRVDISVLMVKLSKKVKSGKISKIKTKK